MMNIPNPPAHDRPSPRRRGRPRGFDVEAALATATLLFWRKGYDGASISDLTAAMGIEAPSLYAAFGSKRALFERALQHYGGAYERYVWERFSAASTARAATQAYLADSAAALSGAVLDTPTGCMTVLTAVDEDAHPEVGRLLRNARETAFGRLAERYARAVADGDMPPGMDAKALARFVQDVQAGMSVLARDGVGADELAQVAAVAMHGWDGAVAAAGDR